MSLQDAIDIILDNLSHYSNHTDVDTETAIKELIEHEGLGINDIFTQIEIDAAASEREE